MSIKLDIFPWFQVINNSIAFRGYIAIAVTLPLSVLFYPTPVLSQITPDSTLGNESSVLTPNVEIKNSKADRIDGGAVRGANLFHSFQEFNINTQQKVYFNNPANINHIFTRITGNNKSNIDGTLGVLGQANLWLINPQGIIFGKNANLDLKGSFVATTAEKIQFAQQGFFSATNPENPSLLTINPSALFFNRNIPTSISYGLTQGGQQTNNNSSLKLANGQSFIFISNDIFLKNSTIKTENGRIELAAIGDNLTVELNLNNNDISLDIPELWQLGNISIDKSNLDVSGEAGGIIQLWGDRINFSDQTNLNADTLGNENGRGINIQARQLIIEGGSQVSASAIENTQGNSGAVKVNALESIDLIGTANPQDNQSGGGGGGNGGGGNGGGGGGNGNAGGEKPSKIASDARGNGQAGGLILNTQILRLKDGAKVSSSTIDASGGGNILINASESVELSGTSGVRQRPSGISVQTRGDGKAGDLTINTKRLLVENGAEITASTLEQGDGGNLIINASELVEVVGAVPIKNSNSQEEVGTTENGLLSSRLAVETGRPRNTTDVGLLIGTGNGGTLNITTNKLSVLDGAEISASSFGEGKGGNLIINASELVEVSGTGENGLLSSRLVAETGRPLLLPSGDTLLGTGDGGNLTVNTNFLHIEYGGQISVSSLGEKSGIAGNLEVNAASVELDNQGKITATTLIGNGGDITINTENLLSMRSQAEISTSAGNEESGGDGGNISLNSPFILAFEADNQISANAFEGAGGNIDIVTNSIFGSQFLNISASSELGIDGTVAIDILELDPISGLVELASNLIDTDSLIAQNACAIDTNNNSFAIVGRGGLPPNPYQTLSVSPIWEDWRLIDNTRENSKTTNLKKQTTSMIIEAQGWVIATNGKLTLTTQPSIITPKNSWFPYFNCSSG